MYARRPYLMFALGVATSLSVVCAAFAEPSSPWPPSAPQVAARVWLEGEPSYYRSGDHLNIRYSVPWDAYVAIIHIDSDGSLDFLYPNDPWDDHWVRGGRDHRLTFRGNSAASLVRGRPGIGYIYIIASPEPLDFHHFFGGRSGWGWDYAGRNVYGDPFLAFEQVSRLLLPQWPYARYAYNYHGYYVGGIHRYPTYACGDRHPGFGWGVTASYGPCGGMNIFLRDNPFYYDTRRYRGDRRVYLERYDRYDPRHGYKEDPTPVGGRNAIPRGPQPAVIRDEPSSAGQGDTQRRDAIPARPAPGAGETRGDAPSRSPAPESRSPATGNRVVEPADRTPAPAPRETGRPTPVPPTRETTTSPRSSVTPAPPAAPVSRPAERGSAAPASRATPPAERASSMGSSAARSAPQPTSRPAASGSSSSSGRSSAQPPSRPEARESSNSGGSSASASTSRTARPRPATD